MTVDDIEGLHFVSENDPYNFHVKYARIIGFVVRKHNVIRNASGTIVTRKFVCNKHGERNPIHVTRADKLRDHRPITQINCDAHLHIHYDVERLRWVVTSFEVCHNHELTPSKFIHLFSAYRGMTDADKAQIDSLHSDCIQTCHIMGHMVANKGGYDVVGFTKKDLYNYFGKKTIVDIKDGDVVASLSYLRGKAGLDPMLYAKYTIDEDGKLKRLFWADGRSRNDFLWFGDVSVCVWSMDEN
ncbi:hypothetical protein TSUD_39380 [Trifolium subterraneum]|uniref:FAR1 domain-containing protein n=1 Tax=Trifolium subterraneum TaxID=3900 RepID=A0A2Z6MDB1_TRISU|nr:hypothetical protein TSUD_39380 [Trifolium subterraneum]